MLKLLLIALPWLAAMPGHAAPRVPDDDREVLERLPLRPRDPAGADRAPAEVLVLRALLRQYRHDFEGAQGSSWCAPIMRPRSASARCSRR